MHSDKLPDSIGLVNMMRARSQEIQSLMVEVEKKMPLQSNQRLPRVMRRRAASNNPKRIPKSCRSSHFKQDKVSAAKDKKRRQLKKHISAKQRQESVIRRKNRPDRSLLHVWFAKRFTMTRLSGHIIPLKNANKNQRTLFRKAKNHCIYFYMSCFLRCFEINGVSVDDFITKISPLTWDVDLLDHLTSKGICTIHVFNDKKQLISPLEVISNKNKLLIWCSFFVEKDVHDFLAQLFPTVSSSDLERIRLVGPEAAEKIKEFLKLDVTFTENQCLVNHEGQLFIRDNIGDRNILDIVIPRSETRVTWSSLVKNRGHFVGGLRNLQMLHFNAGQLLFPAFGYPDHKSNHSEDDSIQVTRGSTIRGLHGMDTQTIIEKLEQNNPMSYLPIMITSHGKGIPIKDSVLFKPSIEDLITISKKEPIDSCVSREACGSVEFGEYCLEAGVGKGMAIILIKDLIEILETNLKRSASQESQDKTRLIFYRKPTSKTFRVAVINFLF